MAVERTLSMIKPDAVGKNLIGKIYTRFEDAGLQIVASRMPPRGGNERLTDEQIRLALDYKVAAIDALHKSE